MRVRKTKLCVFLSDYLGFVKNKYHILYNRLPKIPIYSAVWSKIGMILTMFRTTLYDHVNSVSGF